MSHHIIVARPPVVENPLTEAEPMRFTTGDSIEDAIRQGAPVVTRPATLERVEVDGAVGLDIMQKYIEGYIERAFVMSSMHRSQTIDFWCDEDGLNKDLLPTWVRPSDGWPIRGPILICMGDDKGESHGLTSVYFDDIWGAFSVFGFVNVTRLTSNG